MGGKPCVKRAASTTPLSARSAQALDLVCCFIHVVFGQPFNDVAHFASRALMAAATERNT
jgi:hypothetical protein